MSGVATAPLAPVATITTSTPTISATLCKASLIESLHSLHDEKVAKVSKTSIKQQQKKSIKCIDRFVNSYLAHVTNGSCVNRPSAHHSQTAKQQSQVVKTEPETNDKCQLISSGHQCTSRYQDDFNRMRERLFRLLSKVPIQVETLATDSAPSSSQRTEDGLAWQPLVIKYYHERSLADILELHFGCSLIKYDHEHTFATQPQQISQLQTASNTYTGHDATIYGPTVLESQQRVESIVHYSNGQIHSSNDNQHLHNHNQSHEQHQSYYQTQIEWQHQQQQNFGWQPSAAFGSSPSTTAKFASSQPAKTLQGDTKSNNVSQHHHRRSQSTSVAAKGERGADKLTRAKRTPAARRQIMSVGQRTTSSSSSPSTATMVSTSSHSTDSVDLSGQQIYRQATMLGNQQQNDAVKVKYHEPAEPSLSLTGFDSFAPEAQPAFDLYGRQTVPPGAGQQMHQADHPQYGAYQPQHNQTTNDVILMGAGCSAAFIRPSDTVVQHYYYEQQQPTSYYPSDAPADNYQIHDCSSVGQASWHQGAREQLVVVAAPEQQQQPQMIDQHVASNGLAMNDNYNAHQTNTSSTTTYLPAQVPQSGIYMLYQQAAFDHDNHRPPTIAARSGGSGSLEVPTGAAPLLGTKLTVGGHIDQLHHNHHHHHHPSGSAT